jgi:hypothetical protein
MTPEEKLIEFLIRAIEAARNNSEDMDKVSWEYQDGILISNNDAVLIVKRLEQLNGG